MTAITVADRRPADALGHDTARRLSAFKPTGRLHLGNYLGALRPMVSAQSAASVADSVVMIADLHALTEEHNPAQLRQLTTEVLATLLAGGVDPTATLCYVQSDVPEHAELHYLLECATGYGEAARMIQFKERSANRQHVRLSLLTYPILMAADILLHDADEVPVGDDQTQHVELARDVANRFNTRYGRTFVVPRAVNPPLAARVMDLADPTGKMGKSSASDLGLIYLLDAPDVIRRKVSRAVTDTDTEVAYDPHRRPGVANLLEILAACENAQPTVVATRFASYADLKEAVSEAIVDILRPVRHRYDEIVAQSATLADPTNVAGSDFLDMVRRSGAERARERASRTLRRAKYAIGLST
jgi:tryptophanyl-tRNA synthetase